MGLHAGSLSCVLSFVCRRWYALLRFSCMRLFTVAARAAVACLPLQARRKFVLSAFCMRRIKCGGDLDAQIEQRLDIQRLASDPLPERLPL